MSGYVVAFDTVCEGWQCVKDDDGNPWIYETREAAEAEILSDAQQHWDMAYEGDPLPEYPRPESVDELDDFVIPLNEFLEGRKAIWTGEDIKIEGKSYAGTMGKN